MQKYLELCCTSEVWTHRRICLRMRHRSEPIDCVTEEPGWVRSEFSTSTASTPEAELLSIEQTHLVPLARDLCLLREALATLSSRTRFLSRNQGST